jgi:hypothetical protein
MIVEERVSTMFLNRSGGRARLTNQAMPSLGNEDGGDTPQGRSFAQSNGHRLGFSRREFKTGYRRREVTQSEIVRAAQTIDVVLTLHAIDRKVVRMQADGHRESDNTRRVHHDTAV